jgi:hypothetical protein
VQETVLLPRPASGEEVRDQEIHLLPPPSAPAPAAEVWDQETELLPPPFAPAPAADEVRDREEVDLLPSSAPAPAAEEVLEEAELPPWLPPPAATPAATRPGKRGIPRWALIVGALGAALGLCVCAAGVALFVIGWTAGTPTPAAEPAAAALLYEENFDTPSGWNEYEDEDTSAEYVEGGYRLGVKSADFVTWGNPEDLPQFSDFRIDVDAWQVEGPLDNNLGVLVRYQGDDENFYWFQISSDGYYSVDLMQAGEWVSLLGWETSTAIQQGVGVVNHLRVDCNGSQFDFTVNGTHLATVTDANFASGSIGVAAGAFGEPGVVIQFDNLKVTALEE